MMGGELTLRWQSYCSIQMYPIHVLCTPAIQTLFNVNCIWKEQFLKFWWTQEWWELKPRVEVGGSRQGRVHEARTQSKARLPGVWQQQRGGTRGNDSPWGGEGGSHRFTCVVSLFQTGCNRHSLTVQLLSPRFWEEPSYFSSSPSQQFSSSL